ncbi:MAG: class I SAM-dependent methyltransferase [Bacteroidota bacterium]|jgi:SAM-dependent methyltransferase|nr:class I SAM-dependent methyltransferase [Bacteroidota bacterium]|tara:strand:- start:245 stop:988 length:744 start_codon:yes stop_codon:yes gene_type:complete
MQYGKDWFKTWFNTKYYHILYEDRNYDDAQFFIDNIINELQTSRTDKILDVACGRGRHSIYLSKLKYNVTGIDLSTNNINYAKKAAKNNQLDCNFFTHDMRNEINYKFDLILNMFTSFGYFTEIDNLKTIFAFKKSLNPSGSLIIDFMNLGFVTKNFIKKEVILKKGINFNVKRSISNKKVKKEISFSIENKNYNYIESLSALTLSDFKKMFLKSGLKLIKTYGDYDLKPFNYETSKRLIMLVKNNN